MDYAFVIAIVMAVSLIAYALTGGADYGGGMWDLLASGPRVRRQREAIEAAIAPIWEANHVWLILVVVLLFSAFPRGFGALMTALHIPLTLVLLGIVFRGSAFVFRKYDVQDDRVHRRWSRVFGVASFCTPFFLGLSLGGLASGHIRVEDGVLTTGFFAGWTTAFAVGCGLFAQGLFAFLAAVYLTVDVRGDVELQNDFRARALFAALSLAPAAALVFVLARWQAPELFTRLTSWWAPWLLAGTSLCALGAIGSLWKRRFRLARLLAAGQVALILLGWFLAQYPYLIIPDVAIHDVATEVGTLRLLVWALGLGALLLFPSFGYLYYVFRRRGGGDNVRQGS